MPAQAYKGRGAVSRTAGRFATLKIEPEDGHEESLSPPTTTLRAMQARSIISSNNSPDIPFDRSINPYQGCEHGCVYCYARPSHSYLDLSPGLDFETRIFYKPNAAEALVAEWSKASYECKPITIGANTDPYQPAEKKIGITRKLLATFLEHRHPVSLMTKGSLMSRDLDLLAQLADRGLCSVAVSVPTMNDRRNACWSHACPPPRFDSGSYGTCVPRAFPSACSWHRSSRRLTIQKSNQSSAGPRMPGRFMPPGSFCGCPMNSSRYSPNGLTRTCLSGPDM